MTMAEICMRTGLGTAQAFAALLGLSKRNVIEIDIGDNANTYSFKKVYPVYDGT
jgi:hypothetical protein